MKKLSNFHRKVLNIVVTLLAAIALMLGNVTSVAAYTADTSMTGYPFPLENTAFHIGYYDSSGSGKGLNFPLVKGEQNSYYALNSDKYSNLNFFHLGSENDAFVFPYMPDQFDYYLVGSVGFVSNDVNIDISHVDLRMFHSDSSWSYEALYDLNVFDFNSFVMHGQSIVGRIPYYPEDDSNMANIYLYLDPNSYFSGNVHVSFSIVPVSKTGTEADTLNSILQTLTQINQNLITNNTLQQQTIDAINQNTTNTSNWFTTLITTMQGWFNTQTENLRTWFYMIEERMSAGFTALYHQMTREQDEKLNGYTDTTQSDAADNFNTESDKLTQLEDQLNDQSHDFVSDYTTTGFNTGVLTTLSSSLIFVTTWFANFWNMGGIFTSGLNFCFSLSIVFFILRFRR